MPHTMSKIEAFAGTFLHTCTNCLIRPPTGKSGKGVLTEFRNILTWLALMADGSD